MFGTLPVTLQAAAFSPAELGTTLTGTALDASGYIGIGVAAGAVIMAAMWGLSLGIKAVRKVGK